MNGLIVDNGGVNTTSLVKAGTGTWTLFGANTYTGATTISGGVLNIRNATSLGTTAGGTTVSAGAALQLQGTMAVGAEALTLNGGGISSDGALRSLSGTNSWSGNVALGSASTVGIDAGSLTLSGIVSGNQILTKVGSGTLVLSGTNTYNGVTNINAGVVNIQNSAGLGQTGGGTTVSNGAALQVQGNIAVGNEALTLNGSGIASDGALRNISGTNSWSGALTLGSASTIASDAGTLSLTGNVGNGGFLLTINGAGNVSTSGLISGGGGLTMNGSGTLTLSGSNSNTFTGLTTVNDGTLQLNMTVGKNAYAGTLTVGDGSGAASSAVTRLLASNQMPATTVSVNSDGLLDLNTFSESIGALNMTGGSVTTGTGTLTLGGDVTGNASSSSATISGNLALGASRIFNIADDGTSLQDMIVSAVISGSAFSLTKNGAGTLVLNGADTYSGGTTLNSGTVVINSASSLGASSGALTLNAGILEVAATFSATRNITLGSSSSTIQVDPSQTYTTSGVISSTGTLNKTGAGTLVLGGANTFNGGANISAGTLQVASSGALGSSGTISFGGGTLQYSSSNTTDYSNRFSNAAGQAYSIDTNGQSSTLATALTSSGGTYTNSGTGTLTLTGTNTFNGATVVNGGTLSAAGASASALGSTSAITVNAGRHPFACDRQSN